MPPIKEKLLQVIPWQDFYEGSKGSKYQEALHPSMVVPRQEGDLAALNIRKFLTPEKVKKHGIERCFVRYDRQYVLGKIRWILNPLEDLGVDTIVDLVREALETEDYD